MEIELSSMNPADWRDWEDSLDTIGSPGPFEMDLGFDNFLLATADDFAEPFGLAAAAAAAASQQTLASPPDSPSYNANGAMYQQQCQQPHQQYQQYHQQMMHVRDEDEELLALADAEVFVYEQEQGGVLSEHMFKCESITDLSSCNGSSSSSATGAKRTTQRKRKSTDMTQQQHIKEEPVAFAQMQPASPEKKFKSAEDYRQHQPAKLDEQAERLYRRRHDILHEILEAWNTGGIEDMEEIADSVYDDDVTLISPDYTDGLRGVQAIMNHWNTLLDAFPDGIMEEYEIQREDAHGEKIKATWVFSGTQIFPFFGVEPRHEKVCISGTSFFSFKGDKIQQVVLSWNYREALMKLMGVQPSKAVPGGAISAATAAQMAKILGSSAHR